MFLRVFLPPKQRSHRRVMYYSYYYEILIKIRLKKSFGLSL